MKLQPAIRSGHPRASPLNLHSPKEGINAALDNLLHRARPPVARITRQPHTQAIAVHDSTHLGRRNEYAVFQTFDPEEAITGAIRANGAFDRASRLGGNTVSGLISLTARGTAR